MELLNFVRECRNKMKQRFKEYATNYLSVQYASGLAKTLFIYYKWIIQKKRTELFARMDDECSNAKKKKGRKPKDFKESVNSSQKMEDSNNKINTSLQPLG